MPAVNRYYSSVAVNTTLKFAITDPDATSFEVNSTSGFPTSYPYTLALGYDLSNEELVTIVGASGTILTVGTTVAGGANVAGRGVDGTNNQTHAAAEPVKHVISARDMTEAQAHIAAESGAHGITGSFVGTTDTQALTNKTITGGTVNPTTLQQGGVPAVTTTGTQTLTGKTINSADNTLTVAQSAVTNLTSDLALKAPLANPTFTGTVTLPTGTVTSGMIADGAIVDADINASAAIAQSKVASLTTDLGLKAPLANPTFTGTVAGVTKSMVGLGNVDNTSDTNKPVSTATQTALDGKLSLSGGTVTGATTFSDAVDFTGGYVEANFYYSANGFSSTSGTIETLGNGPIQTAAVELTGAIVRPRTGNTGSVGSSAQRFSNCYLVNQPNVSSDIRNKSEITESTLGLNFINSLNPVSYKVLGDEENRTHYGLIAQEVKQSVDSSGAGDFAGWIGEDESEPNSRQSLAYGEFTAPIIKAIQELLTEVETLKAKVAELEAN
jgi:hypothetical protein